MTLERALFLVWGPPSHGPRSKVFARELGIDVHFVEATRRRGLLVAPYKYVVQAVKTVRLLRRTRPEVIFVQSPPTFAVMAAALSGAAYVIDAHSAAMLWWVWTRPRWLNRILFRRSVATIVTDQHWADWLESIGATPVVIRDIPTSFVTGPKPGLDPGFQVLVVNTFSSDEPLEEVIGAARLTPDVQFHVTGRVEAHPERVPVDLPKNVRFTGFLPDDDYYALMKASSAVICLTTRDHTMQRGACEAVSVGRPIITSDWDLLRTYFDRGTAHVNNTAESIAAAVEQVRDEYPEFLAGIQDLTVAQAAQWDAGRRRLEGLIATRQGAGAGR